MIPAWLMWINTGLALLGNILVIKKKRAGFGCWIISNTILLLQNISLHEWAQAALWSAFLGLAIWAWFSWKK